MVKVGIMLESQENLSWERLFDLANKVEEFGFESLFLSDHLTSVKGNKQLESMALWPALTALSIHTTSIKIGSLVCSSTFRHPAQLAKMAASVDQLSGGRLEIGLGAGWYKEEHDMFGIPFPSAHYRLELLQDCVQILKQLWSGKSIDFAGKHYQLVNAEMYPTPVDKSIPIIVGGMGNTTLKIASMYADEWNAYYIDVNTYMEKARILADHCEDVKRNPDTIRHSLMTPYVIGQRDDDIQDHIDANRAIFPSLPDNLSDWHAQGFVGGSPNQLIDQLSVFVEKGVNRFIFEHNDLDNASRLEMLSQTVVPIVNSM